MPHNLKIQDLLTFVDAEMGPTEWFTVSQERVNQFADATNDHQFIHTKPDKAKQTRFGGTIAHGFLTQSLIPFLISKNTWDIVDQVMSINYGSDKVRFLQPVRTGDRIRAKQVLKQVTEKRPGNWLLKWLITIEIENSEKPALVTEYLEMKIVG